MHPKLDYVAPARPDSPDSPGTPSERGVWCGRWAEQKISLSVAGTTDAPHPALAATLWDLVGRFDEVKRAIEQYAVGLLPDGVVPFESRPRERFAARDCGFELGHYVYIAIGVVDPEAPRTATVAFYTGRPDGYVTFEVTLDAGRPVSITTYFS